MNIEYKKFIQDNSVDGGFLQSEEWHEFQKQVGSKTYTVSGDSGNIFANAMEQSLPVVGNYFFIPRGPILKKEKRKKEIENKISILINLADKNKISWIRIEPQKKEDLQIIKDSLGKKNKIVKSLKNHQPPQTIMVDLIDSDVEILAKMKAKTRYNIRLSKKKGVQVFETKKEKDIEKFLDLLDETARRDRITNHSHKHYRQLLSFNSEIVKLYVARYQGELLAGAIVSFYGEVATYLHGASSSRIRKVMAPYGLQWKIMQDAKQKGCKKYDLGGTKIFRNKEGENEVKNSAWQGISRFKLGFCPKCQLVEFPGSWDIILNNKKYWLYRMLQKVKKNLTKIFSVKSQQFFSNRLKKNKLENAH